MSEERKVYVVIIDNFVKVFEKLEDAEVFYKESVEKLWHDFDFAIENTDATEDDIWHDMYVDEVYDEEELVGWQIEDYGPGAREWTLLYNNAMDDEIQEYKWRLIKGTLQ